MFLPFFWIPSPRHLWPLKSGSVHFQHIHILVKSNLLFLTCFDDWRPVHVVVFTWMVMGIGQLLVIQCFHDKLFNNLFASNRYESVLSKRWVIQNAHLMKRNYHFLKRWYPHMQRYSEFRSAWLAHIRGSGSHFFERSCICLNPPQAQKQRA